MPQCRTLLTNAMLATNPRPVCGTTAPQLAQEPRLLRMLHAEGGGRWVCPVDEALVGHPASYAGPAAALEKVLPASTWAAVAVPTAEPWPPEPPPCDGA